MTEVVVESVLRENNYVHQRGSAIPTAGDSARKPSSLYWVDRYKDTPKRSGLIGTFKQQIIRVK